MKTINVTVKTYYLNLEKENQKKTYNELKEKLKSWGYKLFSCISPIGYDEIEKYRKAIKGKQEIETNYLFNNQFNTVSGYRIFLWKEEIVPNKKIKKGHYIEYSKELMNAIKNQYVCGYCGARYNGKPFKFCNKCLGSEYLEKENYPLLELRSIEKTNFKSTATKQELKDLEKFILSAQNTQREKAFEKRIKEEKGKHQKNLEKAKFEHNLAIFLLENRILNSEWIFYNHTNTIVFGWNSNIDRDKLEKYCEIVFKFDENMNIQYKYEGGILYDWKRGVLV